MSAVFGVDHDRIKSVLLTDGWHPIGHESFGVDAPSCEGDDFFFFRDRHDESWVTGPLSSVLAVRYWDEDGA